MISLSFHKKDLLDYYLKDLLSTSKFSLADGSAFDKYSYINLSFVSMISTIVIISTGREGKEGRTKSRLFYFSAREEWQSGTTETVAADL